MWISLFLYCISSGRCSNSSHSKYWFVITISSALSDLHFFFLKMIQPNNIQAEEQNYFSHQKGSLQESIQTVTQHFQMLDFQVQPHQWVTRVLLKWFVKTSTWPKRKRLILCYSYLLLSWCKKSQLSSKGYDAASWNVFDFLFILFKLLASKHHHDRQVSGTCHVQNNLRSRYGNSPLSNCQNATIGTISL